MGLNTNINHPEGVGPGTILFFTFHSVFKKHNHLRAPKDTSRLHPEMETRVMRVSHPPASLLPTKFLSAPLDATSYSSALAPRAPHLSVHLVQKLVVLHRTSLMALHYLSDSCCRPASICTRFFICKIGMPGSPFLPLLFQ